jgi:hypothetical protein
MPFPTNTYDRYGLVGAREDLIEKITLTNPTKTPFITLVGTMAEVTNTLHEYQRDNLASIDVNNAAIDGNDATNKAIIPTQRIANQCQIFEKTVGVSGRTETIKKAGRGSEMTYQKMKALMEMKRDQEAVYVHQSQVALAGVSNTTAPRLGSFGVHIFTNASHGVGGSTTAHNSGAPTVAPVAGTLRALTQALMETTMQNIYVNSGEMPSTMMVTPSHKVTASTFVGNAVNRYQVGKKEQGRVITGADVIMSNFGELAIVPNYVMATSAANTAYFINEEFVEVGYFRPYFTKDLAVTGDNIRKQIICDTTLRVLSERAQGKIADLTP